MKGQLIPTVFIILLVAGIIVGYVFYNVFYGTKYQEYVFTVHTIDAVRNLAENVKNYLHLSLTYSSQQALREHACTGGSVGSAPWIVNGPNPVEVEFSKACLSNYSKYYFNVYFNLFNTSLPLEIYRDNASFCLYDVNPNDVFSGKYDEGDFWVNCSGAKIVISGEDINEIESIETDDYITKDRYWYLFRNFYEWAKADVYSPCICAAIGCSCSSSSGEEVCSSCSAPVENCAEKALKDLQKRFDDNVVCKKEKMCCKQGIGPPCNGPCGCKGWENGCMAKNDHECVSPELGERPCKLSGKSSYSSFTSLSSNENPYSNGFDLNILSPLSLNGVQGTEACDPRIRIEGRISGGYRYTCQDFKYFVPSNIGPVPLTFTVNAYAFWRDPCACCAPCVCPNCCGCSD